MALPPETRAPKVKKKVKKGPPTPTPRFVASPMKPPSIKQEKPKPRPKPPTRTQVQNAKRQQQGYKRQAGAVRRAAQTQSIVGPGIAVPHKKVQRKSDVKKVQRKRTTQSNLQERRYVSQGQAVEKIANQKNKAQDKKIEKKFGKSATILFKGDDALKKAGFATSDVEKALQKVGKVAFTNRAVKEGVPNIGKNAIDLPANIVPAAAHIAEPVVKHPTKPKAYVEAAKRTGEAAVSLPVALYKDPWDTLINHPLDTALLVNPFGKVPVRSVKAVQRRIPGRERTPDVVELPGTRLKENRPTTTGYVRNIKKKVKPPSKTITAHEIDKRIDEDVALMEGLTRRESAKLAKKIYKTRKKHHVAQGISKKDAKKIAGHEAAETATKLEQAIRAEQTQRMVDTMGLSNKPKYAITANGLRLVQHGGNKARVYKDHAIAQDVAEKATVGDIKFTPVQVQGGYSIVPETAVKRWTEHTDPKIFHPAEAAFRMYSTQWRRNVLALHPTWYTGNVLEAALRSAIAGVGPMSYYRGFKVPKTLKTMDPMMHRELSGRVYGGGHLAMQANLPREYSIQISGNGSLAKTMRGMQDLRKNQLGGKETKTGATTKAIIDAWEGLTDFTMGTLSGGVEGFFQRGMLGKALSKDPIMDGHMIKVSKAAIEDAAKGLRKTENQVKMGRIVDEMYGRYGKWSPGMRRMIANYTPFISWTLNSLNFLGRTLPRDHPVLTALAASVQPYVDEWRKDQGLNKFVEGRLPDFLQGAVPSKEGFARFPTRYTPFAVAAGGTSGIADLVLPQLSNALKMWDTGRNWKDQKINNPDGTPLDDMQKTILSALYILEGSIPGGQQIGQATANYEKGARSPGKVFKLRKTEDIANQFNPFRKVPPPKDKKKVTKKSLFDSSSTKENKSLFAPTQNQQKSLFGP